MKGGVIQRLGRLFGRGCLGRGDVAENQLSQLIRLAIPPDLQDSVDVNDLLLPTYLGHECLLDTDKYMRFSGVQVPESLDVFETFTAGLIPNVEVSYEEE